MKKWIFFILGVSILSGIIFGYWLLVHPAHFAFSGLRAYRSADKDQVKALFEQNKWYLLGDEIMQEYDVDFMLDHASSSQHSALHDLRLQVIEKEGQLVGFCAVYKPTLFVGKILFVVIDQQHRAQGYARALLVDGLQYLFDQAQCAKVMLVTRKENTAAQNLYKKLGFVLSSQDLYVEYTLYKDAFKEQQGSGLKAVARG